MPWVKPLSLALTVVLVVAGWRALHAAQPVQSFLYVGSPQYPCVGSYPCAPTELLVFDARTLGIVTRIPLPGTNVPSLAISPDGRELYVGGGGVVDLTRHVLVSNAGVGDHRANRAAVRRDGGLVFFIQRVIGSFPVLKFDTGTRTERAGLYNGCSFPSDLTTSPSRNSLYLACGDIREFDAATDQQLRVFGNGTVVAADSNRVYGGSNTGVTVYDALTYALLGVLNETTATRIFAGPRGRRVYTIAGQDTAAGRLRIFDATTLSPAALLDVPVAAPANLVASEDESRVFVASTIPSVLGLFGCVGLSAYTNRLYSIDTLTGATVQTAALPDSYRGVFCSAHLGPTADGVTAMGVTLPSAARCSYQLGTAQNVWTVAGGTSTIALTTGCAWMASSDASWVRLSQTSGTTSANLTVTVDRAATGAPRTATLTIAGQFVTISEAGDASTPPFGFFDTPVDGASGISGSLPVTGWALDDTGVTTVRIFRDPLGAEPQTAPIFLGNATMVEGARPDVAAAFSTMPFNTRAGWGLNVLTNLLPNGGTGTFRLYAYVDDIDGHTTILGPRTFTSSNTTATVPFGAIDTPGQGEVVSGTIVCFGWALSPQPNRIPLDGSTIDVVIDGLLVGHPVYNNLRADIAAIFPNYQNTNGAVGYFTIDTTRYVNGMHTLSWIVRDQAGHAAGIGSRYFSIQNP